MEQAHQVNRLPLTERTIFEQIARCWRFPDILAEVERRRVDLAEIHDQSLRRIQADETSRLNVVVFGLTMISAAAVITDLVQFVQEKGVRSPDVWRSGIVAVVALVLLIVAWGVAWRRSGSGLRPVRVKRVSALLDDPNDS